MLKKVLIILLGIIIVFMLFGRERVIFNLDKIRTEYIDDSLSVTIVGTSLSKWSHKYEIIDNDLYLIIYSNHILSPSTDYEGTIYRYL
jgi:hypothetical protein